MQASRQLPGLHWVVGTPQPRVGAGKPLHNAIVVLKGGEIVLSYAKQLLPTYNIFDEHRHFEPGPDVARVLRVGQTQVGLMICEDGWNDEGRDYAVNPFTRMADAAPDLVVVHQRQPLPHRQARTAPPDLRRRQPAPSSADSLRQPGRRAGPDRVRRCVVRGRARPRRHLRGTPLRRRRDHAAFRKRPLPDRQRRTPGCGGSPRFADVCVLPGADRAGPARLCAALRLPPGRRRLVGRHRQRADARAGGRRARAAERGGDHDAIDLLVRRFGR